VQAGVWTIGLVVSWRYLMVVDIREFRAGRCGTSISLLVVGLFYSQHVIALGWITLLLPLLLAGTALILLIQRGRRKALPDVGALDWHRVALFSLLPLSATATYALGASNAWDRWPVASTVYELGGWAGVTFFFVAALSCVARPISQENARQDTGRG
jgi:hypothetical protein